MRNGGRLAAAIELLDLIEADRRPADMLIREFFRSRRYAGSKDRRAVTELVYRVLRNRGLIDWQLGQVKLPENNRLRAFSEASDWDLDGVEDDVHAPEPLTPVEVSGLAGIARLGSGEMPDEAHLNLPEWLCHLMREADPDASTDDLIDALGPRAATDIRVNTLKSSRDAVQAELLAAGIESDPLDWAPAALRLRESARLEGLSGFREGRFEVQDAGSQYTAMLVGARQGERVADICAGAGGKTLAMASSMKGEGILFASDVDGRRLRRLQERASRAGVTAVEYADVSPRSAWPEGWEGAMDRVLIDAPCSGTGTWRRQPEQRWRLTAERLEEVKAIQASVLDRGARLVRPGGRLVYVTCSFLRQENETAVTEFLDRNPGFTITPWADAAREAGLPLPSAQEVEQSMLRLSPYRHRVDGFFAAVMKRALG
jgi:16S rRNA (cytosine967-C5)-methyltransferase